MPFGACKSLTNVSLSAKLIAISPNLFANCTALSHIDIPEKVAGIGPFAFQGCTNLHSVALPRDAGSIGAKAFLGCTTLSNITLGDMLFQVGDGAFEGCSALANVAIPKNVQWLGNAIFYGCTNLGSIEVDSLNLWYSSLNGVLFDKKQVELIQFPGGKGGEYTIPDSVTDVRAYAFYQCVALTRLTIKASVSTFWYPWISGCTALKEFVMDPRDDRFSALDGVWFNKSRTALLHYPGGLTGSYSIPDGVTSVWDYAFSGSANLTEVTMPNGLMSLGVNAFNGCGSLTNANIPRKLVAISSGAFLGCGLVDIAIPENVRYIGDGAFRDCVNIRSVNIENGVISIGRSAFSRCSRLTNITLSTNLTEIGQDAFSSCVSLTNVIIPDPVRTLNGFRDCTNLVSVLGGRGVTSIASSAFYGCARLTGFTLSAGLTRIGAQAFQGCISLTNIVFPKGLTFLSASAFQDCDHLLTAYFKGDAPVDPISAMRFADPMTTVYYLPETKGWTSSFGDRPAILWNPQAELASFTAGRFRFDLTGPPQTFIVIEACDNLSSDAWLPVSTNLLSAAGFEPFGDLQSPVERRFYRFRSP